MIYRATLSALGIVVVCFVIYFASFHHYDPTENNLFAYELKKQGEQSQQRLEEALVFLKNKEYEKAKNAVLLDFEHFKNADSGLYRTERSVYDYTVFMLAADNDPITKYSYIQFTKPIEGVLTQQQLD